MQSYLYIFVSIWYRSVREIKQTTHTHCKNFVQDYENILSVRGISRFSFFGKYLGTLGT